jgi:hypothetical protein
VFTKNIQSITNLNIGEIKEITTPFELSTEGKYIIKYEIKYDNKNIQITTEEYIGKNRIELEDIQIKNFKLGTIAKFDISIKNNWNDKIDETYSEVIITNQNNTVVGKYQSEKNTINPYEDYLTAYWDTANIQPGLYTMKVIVYTQESSYTKDYLINVEYDKIVVENNKKKIDSKMILGITLIIMSLLIFGIVLRYENKKLYK